MYTIGIVLALVVFLTPAIIFLFKLKRKSRIQFRVLNLNSPENVEIAKNQLQHAKKDLDKRLEKLDEARQISPELLKTEINI